MMSDDDDNAIREEKERKSVREKSKKKNQTSVHTSKFDCSLIRSLIRIQILNIARESQSPWKPQTHSVYSVCALYLAADASMLMFARGCLIRSRFGS